MNMGFKRWEKMKMSGGKNHLNAKTKTTAVTKPKFQSAGSRALDSPEQFFNE